MFKGTISPITLKLDPPTPRRFYNLYSRYTDLYNRFHGLGDIKKDISINYIKNSAKNREIRISNDLEASSLTQTLIDTWIRASLFSLKNTSETKGKRTGQIYIARDKSEISGLALQSAVETVIANGIDVVINAKEVFDSQRKNPQIECQSTTFQEFYNDLISRNKKGLSLQGIYISSFNLNDELDEHNNKFAFFIILNADGSFFDINDFKTREEINRISFDAAISGHNPDPTNSGKIEIF